MCSFVPRDLLVEPSLPARRCERCALTAHAFHGSAKCERIHWLFLEMKLVASSTHSECVLNECFGLRGDETNVSSLDIIPFRQVANLFMAIWRFPNSRNRCEFRRGISRRNKDRWRRAFQEPLYEGLERCPRWVICDRTIAGQINQCPPCLR